MSSGTNMKKITTGFTLMEMMVVIVLLAVVGNVAAPVYNSHVATEDASRFVQLIRTARYQALETQVFHRFLIIPDEERYLVQRYLSGGSLADYLNPASTAWESILEEEEVFFSPGITVESELNAFFMRPDGIIVIEPKFEALPIPEVIATFSYSGVAISVNISSIGLVSSEQYDE